MGLLDWFRRAPAPPPVDPVGEWQARGRLEAKVDSLELQWATYRDQLNKLVQRLEKRDQRAAAREAQEVVPDVEPDGFDELEAQRELFRRKNGLLHGRGAG